MDANRGMWTTAEVGERFGVTSQTVRRLVNRWQIPVVRVPRGTAADMIRLDAEGVALVGSHLNDAVPSGDESTDDAASTAPDATRPIVHEAWGLDDDLAVASDVVENARARAEQAEAALELERLRSEIAELNRKVKKLRRQRDASRRVAKRRGLEVEQALGLAREALAACAQTRSAAADREADLLRRSAVQVDLIVELAERRGSA